MNKPYFESIDWRDILALTALLLFWLFFLIGSPASLHEALVDDAYIFQRVVDNIWNGLGWTYNTDARVNPITSPFYALLLLGGKVFGFSAQATISLIYCLALILIGVCLYASMRPYGRWLAWVMAVTVSSGSILIGSWGMETSVFMACVVGAILCFARKRLLVAGLLCTFATLSRPEGAAMIGILSIAHMRTDRKIPWGMIMVFVATLVPWLLYSWVEHGYILPNSVSVKAIQSDMIWRRPFGSWPMYFLVQPKIPVLTYAIAVFGCFHAWREFVEGRPFILLVVAFGVVQVTAYSVMQAPVGYFWYLAPGNFAVDVAVAFGLYKIVSAVFFWLQSRGGLASINEYKEVCAALCVFLGMLAFSAAPYTLVKSYRLGDEYTQVGVWIDINAPKDAVVAATEIGYIGYFSNRQIRDIHGLIHPEARPFLKKEEWDWWFKNSPPQVIVMHKPAWPGEPGHESGWGADALKSFRDNYRMVKSFGSMEVYQR